MSKHTATATLTLKEGNLNPLHPKAWEFKIDGGWSAFLARSLPKMVKKGETAFSVNLTIEKVTNRKTYPQLKYLNGVVYPAFFEEFERLHGIRQPDEYVKRKLKMNEQVCFYVEVTDPFTAEIEYEAKSCAGASVEDVMELIDRLLALAASIALDIETPQEWCAKNGVRYEDFRQTGSIKKAKVALNSLMEPGPD